MNDRFTIWMKSWRWCPSKIERPKQWSSSPTAPHVFWTMRRHRGGKSLQGPTLLVDQGAVFYLWKVPLISSLRVYIDDGGLWTILTIGLWHLSIQFLEHHLQQPLWGIPFITSATECYGTAIIMLSEKRWQWHDDHSTESICLCFWCQVPTVNPIHPSYWQTPWSSCVPDPHYIIHTKGIGESGTRAHWYYSVHYIIFQWYSMYCF